MNWEPEAEQALKSVPFFVRPLVRRKVEERVGGQGGRRVTLAHFREAEVRYQSVAAGKSEVELQEMMPQPNRAGVSLVVVETCHAELSNCPHPVIKPSEWKQAVDDYLAKNEISEQLRKKIADPTILFHHKFKISISGCPNGCSRPQIADFGLLGRGRPELRRENCTQCGECVAACPDRAVTLDADGPVIDWSCCLLCKDCHTACDSDCIKLPQVGVQVVLGGKLGRHPHLADPVLELAGREEALGLLDKVLQGFIQDGLPNERFADYWLRLGRSRTVAQ